LEILQPDSSKNMPQLDVRLQLIDQWLQRELKLPLQALVPASSDASFRRYFRITCRDGRSLIVMDAPPDKENIQPYLHVTRLLQSIGVHVPTVYEVDTVRGLILLEDLGATSYLMQLQAGSDPKSLYGDALQALLQISAHGQDAAAALEPYDHQALHRELMLMPEWFCQRHLSLDLSAGEISLLASTFEMLIAEALAQPTVFVHRDYHSRNLMVLAQGNPGIIDFQDAVRGPLTYDLVSLLKDCYITWPREKVCHWVSQYRVLLQAQNLPVGQDDHQFLRWFDLMGLQRHIKILGIFARLWYRDGKPGYLQDLPLTLKYVQEASAAYPQLREFSQFVQQRVAPALPVANARILSR
jgi:N-acetylmuramate 1-kinase